MEFEFSSTFILIVCTLLLMIKLLKKSRSSDDASSLLLNRIPGPRKLPVIGNLHLLAGKSPPHHVFRDLATKYGPLTRLQLGGVPVLIISSVEVAKQVLHDVAFANKAPVFAFAKISYNNKDIAMSPYGEYWRQLRKICTLELLSWRRVRSFHPIREEVNSNMAKWIASNEGSPVNLSERISISSFDVIARASIGKESEEKQAMISATKDVAKLASGLSVVDLYPSQRLLPMITGMKFKMERNFRQTDRILERIINDHREAKAGASGRSEDLVDVLLKYQEDEDGVHLTDDNIKAVIMDAFMAGAETSATATDWVMLEMVRNPTALKTAQDEVRRVFDGKGFVSEEKLEELKYLKLVIKEALRLHPPAPFLQFRMSSEKCEINGYEIPAKTRLMVNAWALGRDPKYWNDTEAFMPERFEDNSIDFKGNNLEYIPFGAGRRICPGMLFGLVNMEFFLANLLYHFDWEMPNGIKNEDLDMSEELGATLKRKHDLVLIPTLKRPLVG